MCIALLAGVMIHSLGDCPAMNLCGSTHAEAEWLYEQGDYRASAECYGQILQRNPRDSVALNNLAWINVEHLGRDLHLSLRMAQRAVELRWHTPEYQDTLGWAYYKLGQRDRAVGPLRLAEQFGPYDPIFPAHLGEVYEAQGRLADARAAYRRALELDPTCDEAQRGLRFLECDD